MSSFENSIWNIMSEGVNHLRVTRHDCNANLRSVSHFLYTKHLQRWPVDISVLLCLLDNHYLKISPEKKCVSLPAMCGNCTCKAQVWKQYSEDFKM